MRLIRSLCRDGIGSREWVMAGMGQGCGGEEGEGWQWLWGSSLQRVAFRGDGQNSGS